MTNPEIPWGPTGETVYKRTYSRIKANGKNETWPETVHRVASGNLALVHGDQMDRWDVSIKQEYADLVEMMEQFKIIPAGRQLWATGAKGRQYLFNCHVAGWGEKLSDHFRFSFLRLMEGGGVGANYSTKYLAPFGSPRRKLEVHIVCDPSHPDYEELKPYLSTEYHHAWEGAYAVEDSREGWANALVDLIDTFMTPTQVFHKQRVYDVTRVRGRGQPLRTFGGHASGPPPFAKMMHETGRVLVEASKDLYLTPLQAMEIDHAIAECVVSGGNRRSARMSQVHWQDQDIWKFINCKADTGKHWTTNISVEIDQKFIDQLNAGWYAATEIHAAVVAGMLNNGEPGYWNSDLSNEGEVGLVEATNPCGEIGLEAWENCNLGHINLDAFAPSDYGYTEPTWDELLHAHRLMTRMLIRSTFGDINDPVQAEVVRRNRRIGVGHLGVQGYYAKQGYRYSQVPRQAELLTELCDLRDVVRQEAREYAFQLRIPEPIKVTTVAPTGSIAKLPGVSEGIHPIYARHFLRRVRFSKVSSAEREQVEAFRQQGYTVEQDIYDSSGNTAVVVFPTKEKLVAEVEALGYDPRIVESADELSLDDMLAFQAMYQQCYADNSVSFTANLQPGSDPKETAETIAKWLPKLKGMTIMVDGSRPQAPYQRLSEEQYRMYDTTVVADGTDEECASGACPIR